MPKAKPLSKVQILGAVNKTKSNRAAARYLGVSYIHYKKWAKNYDATEEGYPNLFEQHKNQSGKGIPKFLNGGKKNPAILDIIEGRVDPSHFDAVKIKDKLIADGYLEECCSSCGFSERRVLDYRVPLLMHFKDSNKKNYKLDNLILLVPSERAVSGSLWVSKNKPSIPTAAAALAKGSTKCLLDPWLPPEHPF